MVGLRDIDHLSLYIQTTIAVAYFVQGSDVVSGGSSASGGSSFRAFIFDLPLLF